MESRPSRPEQALVELSTGMAGAEFLDWTEFTELLDEHKALGTREVCFSGSGEPLRHPRAWEALDLSLSLGFFTELHTPLVCSSPTTPERIIESGLHQLVVHLESSGEEVLEAVARLCRLRSDRPQVRLQVELRELSAGVLDSLVDFAECSRVEEIEVLIEDSVATFPGDSAADLLPAVEQLSARAPWRRPRLVAGPELMSRLRQWASPRAPASRARREAKGKSNDLGRRTSAAAGKKGDRAMSFPGDEPEFSVVIPTHAGSSLWLADCLDAVARLQGPVPEVLVVIDGPAPEIEALVREHLPAARQLRLARNRGFAEAASAGLRSARGKLVALLNDDAAPDPQWLEAMACAAAEHPDAGFFASRVLQLSAPHLIDSAGHGLCRWGEAFDIGAEAEDGPEFDTNRWVFGAPASAAVYRRALLEDCGGFDGIMEAYLEDVDLSLRAQLLGFPCLYVAAAKVRHRGSSSYGAASGSRRDRQLAARNRIRLMLRSMPADTLRTAGAAAALSIAAGLAHSVLSRTAPLATAVGTLEGLGDASASISGRADALGRRRVDDAWMRAVLRNSEQRLLELGEQRNAGHWRRGRATLARSLSALVDRRERRGTTTSWRG